MPRCPPESAGFSTAGTPTASSAARALSRSRAAAKRGCGTPASASVRRIAILCVIRCAVSVPIPGRPSASATAATTGTARSADTVRTPSTEWRRATSVTASTFVKSTASATSATPRPSASGLRSTATTRKPSSRARRIARRWCRPAPTKRTVFTGATLDESERALPVAGDQEAQLVEARDLAAVGQTEPDPHAAPLVGAGDQSLVRAAVLLCAEQIRVRRRERVLERGEPATGVAFARQRSERAADGIAAQRRRLLHVLVGAVRPVADRQARARLGSGRGSGRGGSAADGDSQSDEGG